MAIEFHVHTEGTHIGGDQIFLLGMSSKYQQPLDPEVSARDLTHVCAREVDLSKS
jgi:hypothetical protein